MRRLISLSLLAVSLVAAPPRTQKDPQSIEDFRIDWSASTSSNAIVSSTWSASPSGLTQVSSGFTSTASLIRLSGGTTRMTYTVTNKVTLTDGQVLVQSFLVEVSPQ